AEEERVHGVAAGGEKAAAAGVLFGVPAELSVPRADAVEVIDFAVVNFAEEAAIDDGFGGEELAGVAAFEADAGFHASGFDGLLDVEAIAPIQREWFFDDEMFGGAR